MCMSYSLPLDDERSRYVESNKTYECILQELQVYWIHDSIRHHCIHYNRTDQNTSKIRHLCSPNILTSSLDPVTELINTSIPILKTVSHAINLIHIKNLRLNPVDLCNLSNLINRSTQQTQRQSLHNEMLDLIGLNLSLGRNSLEGQRAVMRGTVEDHLRECRERDLLVQEYPVGLQQLVLADVTGQHIVGSQITPVEGEEKLAEPVVRGLSERV
jgi:hypothetical protein